MNKLCVAYFGALLLLLQLTAQVALGQNSTDPSVNTTNTTNVTSGTAVSTNATDTSDKNGCVRSDPGAALLLLPLVAWGLHSWS